MKKLVAAAMAVSLCVSLGACSKDDADKMKDTASSAAADAKSGADKAADAAKDGADKAVDAVKDGADKAADAAKDGADKAADAAKDGADKLAGLVSVTDAQGATVDIPKDVKEAWEANGGESGSLGAITNVTERNGEDYIVETASGDAITYSKDTGAVLLKGMIKETWFKDGGFENPVGLPTAPEQTLSDGSGWSQKFANGTIQWTNAETGEFHAVVS